MTVYSVLLILTVLSLFIYKYRKKRIYSIVPFALMAFVGGFRYNVGADYANYEWIFSYVLTHPGKVDYAEFGYRELIRLSNLIGGTNQLVFLICSILTCYFYYKFIYENSVDFELSTLLYMCLGPFYFSSFNGVRQALSVSIVLYAMKYCYENRRKYIVFVILASLFHTSSLIMLLMVLTKKLKNNYGIYTIILAGGGYVITRSYLVDYFLSHSSYYSKYITSNQNYWSSSYILFLFLALFAFFWTPLKRALERRYMYILCFTAALILFGYGYDRYSMLITRFISWGSPIFILLIPQITQRFKPKIACNLVVCSFCFIYYFYIARYGAAMYPYSFNFKIF